MSPFGKLFWGFLIVFVDIRIDGFDLLIDLVGYVLVVIGLGELSRRNRMFARARPYATVLLVLSGLDLFTSSTEGSGLGLFGRTELAVVYFGLLFIVNLLLVYFVCRGIREMATQAGRTELADLALTRWVFFASMYVLSTVLVILATSHSDLTLLAFVALAAGFVAALLIAGLLRRADKAFYPRGA